MNLKTIVGLLIIGLFITGSCSSILQADIMQEQPFSLSDTLRFSQPIISQTDHHIHIEVPETDTYLREMGKPLLPAQTTIYTLPLGTTITDITVKTGEIKTKQIKDTIQPSPLPQPYDTRVTGSIELLETFYQKGDDYDFTGFYPENWYDYSIKIGLDEDNIRKTFVIVQKYPVRYSIEEQLIQYTTDLEIDVRYTQQPVQLVTDESYDFLIISGSAYLDELQSFVTYKENRGIATKLVSIDDIDTPGVDTQEQIKYYIKDAIEQWDITNVLLVGGHRSFFGFNNPSLQIPLRYIDLDDTGEPGYVSDVYYSDIYAYDEGSGTMVFSTWDTDEDGKYGEWYYINDDVTDKQDEVDLIPDVHLGRWACRTEQEATIMVNKVMTYEQTNYQNLDWFKKMIVLSGDDFQDQLMLDIAWDTTGLSGTYTIHAQSTNINDETLGEDTVTITIDHTQNSNISFSEMDHLKTNHVFPNLPVAEITVPADGNTLGMDDVFVQSPPNAYIGERWTPINYTNKILKIQGKSYNPQPHTETPINTTLEVWVTDETGITIFGPIIKDLGMYFEGEWATQKAIDFMPEDFSSVKLWTSMGTFKGTEDDVHDAIDSVVDQLSQGSGFMYIAGHANPMVYANHYPGIPGGRANGDVVGLTQFNPFRGLSLNKMFPLRALNNAEKQPVLVLSGCHPCQLDVNFLRLLSEKKYAIWYGTYVWESLGWWLTRLEDRGAIATLGPTGLGYGGVGPWGTQALGGWLWPEFFRQHSQEGKTIIGEAWTQALKNYITEFGPDLDLIDTKTVEEMVLLGDPTLQIG